MGVGGATNFRGGEATYCFAIFFGKNCVKMKEFGPGGGIRQTLCVNRYPLGSATDCHQNNEKRMGLSLILYVIHTIFMGTMLNFTLHRAKSETKAKLFFGVCRFLFDIFHFRLRFNLV